MQFDESKIIKALISQWSWALPSIESIIAVNSMGNVMLRDDDHNYWYICPEELTAEVFARTQDELQLGYADTKRKEEWQMSSLVSELVEVFGEPLIGECFGFITPAVFGGDFSVENIRRRDLYEYLRYSGDIANQTKDLKDGETVKFEIT